MMRENHKEQLVNQLLAQGADTYEHRGVDYVSYCPTLWDEEEPGHCINISDLACRTREKLSLKDVSLKITGMPDRYVVNTKYGDVRMDVLVNDSYVEIREVVGPLDEFVKLVVFIREYIKAHHKEIYRRLLEALYSEEEPDDELGELCDFAQA